MGGSKERQEGNYASSALSISGGLPLENDLGLTLLPGSQIEQSCKRLLEDTADGNSCHGLDISGNAHIYIEDKGLQQSRQFPSPSLERDRDAQIATHENSPDKSQTETVILDKELATRNQSKHLGSKQKLSRQLEILTTLGDSRLQYSRRVRASTEARQEDRAYKKRRTAILRLRNDTRDMFLGRAKPQNDDLFTNSEQRKSMSSLFREDQRALPTPPPSLNSTSSQTSSSSLISTNAQKMALCSTAVYPPCSKWRFSRSKVPSLGTSLSPQPPGSSNEQLLVDYLTCEKPAQAFTLLRAELKQTKGELFQRTKTESDALHAMYKLGKAYNKLLATESAHLELQTVHTNLLEEHRRLLKSYDTLANVHAACRSTSSRKLAQRIVDSAPSSKKPTQAYPSPSPSTTTCPVYGSHANFNAIVQSSGLTTPLIDLTRSPSPDTAAPLLSSGAKSAPILERDSHGRRDDANYANINGFDEEANEIFDAFWESEMRDLSTQNGEATGV